MVKRFLVATWLFTAILSSSTAPLYADSKPGVPSVTSSNVYVMAPLQITDWGKFHSDLRTLSDLGFKGITVDVWWGMVQARGPGADDFDWEYYKRVFQEVRDAKLKVVPILSSHACGGNVGDTVNIPLPSWLFSLYPGITTVSEALNANTEYPSVWSTPQILPALSLFWTSFLETFKTFSDIITEIPISMGASGELQYPNHHSHDKNVRESYFPNRGIIQAFSPLAIESFRKWVFEVQHPDMDIPRLRDFWGFDSLTSEQVSTLLIFSQMNSSGKLIPATNFDVGVGRVNDFFNRQGQFSNFGRDFFKWYQGSLDHHLELMLTQATEILQSATSSFRGIPLAVKIPGDHWREGSDRLAALTSAAINSLDPSIFPMPSIPDWQPVSSDYGYKAPFDVIQKVRSTHPNLNVILTYTAIEMPDSPDWEPSSRGHTIPKIISALGKNYGIPVSGENALADSLKDGSAIDRMFQFLWNGFVDHLVLLRMDNVIEQIQQNGPLKSAVCRNFLEPKKAAQ